MTDEIATTSEDFTAWLSETLRRFGITRGSDALALQNVRGGQELWLCNELALLLIRDQRVSDLRMEPSCGDGSRDRHDFELKFEAKQRSIEIKILHASYQAKGIESIRDRLERNHRLDNKPTIVCMYIRPNIRSRCTMDDALNDLKKDVDARNPDILTSYELMRPIVCNDRGSFGWLVLNPLR